MNRQKWTTLCTCIENDQNQPGKFVWRQKISSQGHQGCPSWQEAEQAFGMWGASVLGGPASQSCCPIAEVQAIPPAPATCPSPSLRARGVGEGQMVLEGQAASWVQHPPHPQPQSYMPGPTSTLWPPFPLQSKPLSPSARQCCMTGQTQSFTKINPLSLLCSCLGLQEKLSQCVKDPSCLLAKQHSRL